MTLPGLADSIMTKLAKIRVGEYNMKKMAAVMIFPDPTCKTIPRRYFFDPADGEDTFYNYEDMIR